MFENHACYEIRAGAGDPDHDRFPFKLLDRFKLWAGDQHKGKGRYKAGDDSNWNSSGCGRDRSSANAAIIVDVSIDQSRIRSGRPDPNYLGVETFLFKETFFLR